MNARRRGSWEQGFTLMEIAAASVPLALIGLLLFSVFGFTVSFSRRGEQQTEAVQQARMALHLMAKELRESSATPGAVVIWSRSRGAARDGVGFLVARGDAPGHPFLTDDNGTPLWQEAVYYLHDEATGELRRLTGEPGVIMSPQSSGRGRIVARQVSRLRVVRQQDLIIISVTVGPSAREAVLETAVRPRN